MLVLVLRLLRLERRVDAGLESGEVRLAREGVTGLLAAVLCVAAVEVVGRGGV